MNKLSKIWIVALAVGSAFAVGCASEETEETAEAPADVVAMGGTAADGAAIEAAAAAAMSDPIEWADSIEDAQARATETDRVVMLKFEAEWCGPCHYLTDEVFPSQEARKMLSDKVVALAVDVDRDPGLAQRFETNGIVPVVVFADADLEPIGRLDGAPSGPRQVDAYLRRLVAEIDEA